ncbi:MAG: hypothetical protein KDA66_04785 [Planctomycetaceae bacterium]|nr:hypothetical protein [Planctomycetaceae bacterium]
MPQIQINSIVCLATSESGHDEVYLICQADAGIPIRVPAQLAESHAMSPSTSDNTWTFDDPQLILNYEYEVLVTLWDEDLSYDPNLATYLQSNDFQYDGTNNGSIQLSNPNGAMYTINFTRIN